MMIAAGVFASVGDPMITCDPGNPAKCSCDGVPIGPATWSPPSWLKSSHTSIYDTYATIKGVNTSLANYRANATMLVNVASA